MGCVKHNGTYRSSFRLRSSPFTEGIIDKVEGSRSATHASVTVDVMKGVLLKLSLYRYVGPQGQLREQGKKALAP